MLRLSLRRPLSQKWSLCSTQILSMLADHHQDTTGKTMQLARNFLRDMDIASVVSQPDDALELLYYMQRVEYPKGSKLESQVRDWLAQASDHFTAEHMILVCQYVKERVNISTSSSTAVLAKPSGIIDGAGGGSGFIKSSRSSASAVDLWNRALLRSGWFRQKLQETAPNLNLDQVILISKMLTWTANPEWSGLSTSPSSTSSAKSPPDVPGNQNSQADRDLIATVCTRCAEIVAAATEKHSPRGKKKSTISPSPSLSTKMTTQHVADVLSFVAPHDSSGHLHKSVHEYLKRVTAQDVLEVLRLHLAEGTTAPQEDTVMSLLGTLLRHCGDGRGGSSSSPAASSQKGGKEIVRLLIDALELFPTHFQYRKTLQQRKRAEDSLDQTLHATLQSLLAIALSVDSLTDDDLETIMLLENRLHNRGGPSPADSIQKLIQKAAHSAPLSFYLASLTGDEEQIRAQFARLSTVSHAADSGAMVTNRRVTVPSASDHRFIVRGLAVTLLRDERHQHIAGGAHCWLLVDAPPGGLQCVTQLVAQAADAFQTNLHVSVLDMASLVYVVCMTAEAHRIKEPRVATTDASLPPILVSRSNLNDFISHSIQRLVYSSKFNKTKAGGGGSGAGGSSSTVSLSTPSPSTGHNSSSTASTPLHWGLDTARLVLTGLAAVSYDAFNQVALMDNLERVFADTVAIAERGDALPLNLRQATQLLVALHDTRMQSSPELLRLVLLLVLRAASSSADVASLLECMTSNSVLYLRDIHVICTLFRELSAHGERLDPIHVIQAADCARRLRLVQQFQQSGLSRHIQQLRYYNNNNNNSNSNSSSKLSLHPVAGSGSGLGSSYDSSKMLSLEHFATLLSAVSADEQRRLFDLLRATTVSTDRAQSHSHGRGGGGGGDARTLLEVYAEELPSYLVAHPSVALMLLCTKECPKPLLTVICKFLETAPALHKDVQDQDAVVQAVRTVGQMVADRATTTATQPSAPARVGTAEGGVEERLFADLICFGAESVLIMSEANVGEVVQTARMMHHVPNRVFRVLGRRIGSISDHMTADNALRSLELYAAYKVRDDRVVKGLLYRCAVTIGSIGGSVELTASLRRVCDVYPHWSSTALNAIKKYSMIREQRERKNAFR